MYEERMRVEEDLLELVALVLHGYLKEMGRRKDGEKDEKS